MSFYTQNHTAAELVGIFDRVFGARLLFCGFERIGPRRWVLETGKSFKFLFHVGSDFRGGYSPCGAISLDFVPRITARKVKVHTGIKYVVGHHSVDQYLSTRAGWRKWAISAKRDGIDEHLARIASESVPEITNAFKMFNSVDDVCASIQREKDAAANNNGFYCYPLQALAFAFCLARLGRRDEARDEFERSLKSPFFDEDHHLAIRNCFEQELADSCRVALTGGGS